MSLDKIIAGATILLTYYGLKNQNIGARSGIVPLAAIFYGFLRITHEGAAEREVIS